MAGRGAAVGAPPPGFDDDEMDVDAGALAELDDIVAQQLSRVREGVVEGRMELNGPTRALCFHAHPLPFSFLSQTQTAALTQRAAAAAALSAAGSSGSGVPAAAHHHHHGAPPGAGAGGRPPPPRRRMTLRKRG